MLISGVLATVLVGAFGALLFEAVRMVKSWKHVGVREVVTSVLVIACGGLVPLIYGTSDRNFIEVAQLGIGIPALVSAGFIVASPSANRSLRRQTVLPEGDSVAVDGGPQAKPVAKRSLADYLALR